MLDLLIFLTNLAIIILAGIICSIFAKKFKLPDVLLLLTSGILMGNFVLFGKRIIEFEDTFIAGISIVALVMIVFDSSSRFKLKEFDAASINVLMLTFLFLVINVIVLSIGSYFLFGLESVFIALMFATLMSGTDPGAVLSMLKGTRNKVLNFIEFESVLNTPLMVLFPFLIVDMMTEVSISAVIPEYIKSFFLKLVAGIGAGVMIGLIFFKIMRKQYEERISPLALIAGSLLAYIVAENLGGNGVLAVTTIGLVFGNVYIKEKEHLMEFSFIFSQFFEIIVFIVIGMMIQLNFTDYMFFIKSLFLFILFLGARYISVIIALRNSKFNHHEKLFITLNVSKGIAVAVVTALFLTLGIPGFRSIVGLILIFLLYSIIISSVVIKFSDRFIRFKVIK